MAIEIVDSRAMIPANEMMTRLVAIRAATGADDAAARHINAKG